MKAGAERLPQKHSFRFSDLEDESLGGQCGVRKPYVGFQERLVDRDGERERKWFLVFHCFSL